MQQNFFQAKLKMIMSPHVFCLLLLLLSLRLFGALAEQCGEQVNGTICPDQAKDLGQVITQIQFENMLKHRSEGNCRGGFYTHQAFITAARSFSDFGNNGPIEVRRREVAAFLAQTSHETSGGSPGSPDGPYAWGYCFVEERGNPGPFCAPSPQWPCAAGKKYYGRGPFQISWNFNYGPAGKAIGVDLIKNPDLVAKDPVISFKTALWFWMTPQPPKPSPHQVITGHWDPSPADRAANRLLGYGLITNIITGGLECGKGPNQRVQNRIGFYSRYCTKLGTRPADNMDCANQKPFGS